MPKIPGVSADQAVRALKKAGFVTLRQGRHIVMSNGQVRLTIPRHDPINAYTNGRYRKGRRVQPRRVQGSASLRDYVSCQGHGGVKSSHVEGTACFDLSQQVPGVNFGSYGRRYARRHVIEVVVKLSVERNMIFQPPSMPGTA
jgi:predicted RNA binding protein YcfA (HicA-like mRNA interferase family)